jgi:hypothetical protein
MSLRVPDNEFLVMGGDRWPSALSVAKSPIDVTLAVIWGPVRQDCLQDLVHWQHR